MGSVSQMGVQVSCNDEANPRDMAHLMWLRAAPAFYVNQLVMLLVATEDGIYLSRRNQL